ncbi:hypothetical protein [Effusibacillus dendaii]|uniref:Uncharacterized protein n=1 Tax=Effusibacillus dendaii TaxID=2743772 RepID=A0A7I8DG07_9BACL|nr:hypothetical protein [Effusibacillus dendaii]BCJ87889.1 hypothetical protein skT53_28740 [Effusibacillus dendaii]
MSFVVGAAQVVVFLLAVKMAHILYWNLKKVYPIHSWLTETILAILFVILVHFTSNVWGLVLSVSVIAGAVRGDQEASGATDRKFR